MNLIKAHLYGGLDLGQVLAQLPSLILCEHDIVKFIMLGIHYPLYY